MPRGGNEESQGRETTPTLLETLCATEDTIPIELHLAAADATAKRTPLPFFLTVPRRSIAAALWKPAVDAFSGFVADFGSPPSVWITLRSTETPSLEPSATRAAVPWQLPLGVLVDLLSSAAVPAVLPLSFVVHFSPPATGSAPRWTIARQKDAHLVAQQTLKQALMGTFADLRPFYKAAPAQVDGYVRGALGELSTAMFREAMGAMEAVGRQAYVQSSSANDDDDDDKETEEGASARDTTSPLPSATSTTAASQPPASSPPASSSSSSPPETPPPPRRSGGVGPQEYVLVAIYIICEDHTVATVPTTGTLRRVPLPADDATTIVDVLEEGEIGGAASMASRLCVIDGLVDVGGVPLRWAARHLRSTDFVLHIVLRPR